MKRSASRSSRSSSSRRSLLKTILVFAGVFLWIPVVMGLVLSYLWAAVPYRGYAGDRQFVIIPPNRPATEVLRVLQERGVLRPGPFGRIYLAATGRAAGLKAGEYLFDRPLTAPQVLGRLIRGDIHYHRVTVPEGLRSAEVFAQFIREGFGTEGEYRQEFLDTSRIAGLDADAADLEGYLFPDTYLLPRGATARAVVDLMVGRQLELWNEEWKELARERGMSVREVVTLASLIEKETASAQERTLVSSVFHNRLKKGMRLQCDPTIIYALVMRDRYNGRILRSHLGLDSRYNTYVHTGLPPGPIANPGREAVRAALQPEDTDYLYFVSMNTGRHTFSTNLRDHSRAVQKFQR